MEVSPFWIRALVSSVFGFLPLLVALILLNRGRSGANPVYAYFVIWGIFIAPLVTFGFRTSNGDPLISSDDPLLQWSGFLEAPHISEEIAKFIGPFFVYILFYGRFNVVKAGVLVAVAFASVENMGWFYVVSGWMDIWTADFWHYVLYRSTITVWGHIAYTSLALYGLRIFFLWPVTLFLGMFFHWWYNFNIYAYNYDLGIIALILNSILVIAMWLPWLWYGGRSAAFVTTFPVKINPHVIKLGAGR